MVSKDVEERIKLLEKIGGIIREESRAYGIIDAVWGGAILSGFLIFQLVEILSMPWYFGLIPLVTLIFAALIMTVVLKRKISRSIGFAGKTYIGERIRRAWLLIAFVAGTSFMLTFWNLPVIDEILENLSSAEITGLILTGWLIVDGIGCMVQGVISESKAYTSIGIAMVVSPVIIARVGLIYAWTAFALTFGLGYLITGLRDYRIFKKSERVGVKIE
jgi:hypothetical protein